MPFKKIIGIYKITNTMNNKVYIGSSRNALSRLSSHKSLLIKNKHFNRHLQNAWLMYGSEAFTFEILEECYENQLTNMEERYIHLYESNNNSKGYNVRTDCTRNTGIKFSDEIRQKLSLSHIGHKRSEEAHRKILATQYKPVCQISKDGQLIKIYPSMLEAESSTNTRRQAISACCRGKLKSSNGWQWCYLKDKDKKMEEKYAKRNKWN